MEMGMKREKDQNDTNRKINTQELGLKLALLREAQGK